MDILNSMKDIVKHTSSLGFIDMVKIVGTEEDAKIEAIDADKTVVVYGSMYQPITGLDKTVGLSRMGVLKGILDFPGFADTGAKVEVTTESRGGDTVPTEIKFESGAGHVANYRFMSEVMVSEQIKVPPFKGATWNLTIQPEKKNITELSYWSGVLGGTEKRFIATVDGSNTLNFLVGTGPTDRTTVPFAKNVTGTLKHQWSWPLAQVLSILKLGDTAQSLTMYFSDMGAMKIEIDSAMGKYSYILPASKS